MARVLVVDDCGDTALTLAMLLKHCGHETAVADGGNAALQHATVFHPDAMFIDLTMPEVDGLSVARQLRQQAEFAELPLVAVSGYVDRQHRAQATAAGFTEFLPKPYSLKALQATMERIGIKLRTSRAMSETGRFTAEQTRQLNEQSRRGLDAYWRTRQPGPVAVSVEKSGISNIVAVPHRTDAEELRSWLKGQRCKVGPVFEPGGRYGFYVYSKRNFIAELIAKHGGFQVVR